MIKKVGVIDQVQKEVMLLFWVTLSLPLPSLLPLSPFLFHPLLYLLPQPPFILPGRACGADGARSPYRIAWEFGTEDCNMLSPS